MDSDNARVLETERLVLRRLAVEDAPFIVDLLNQPSFLRYIGDKKVRNEEDAIGYLKTGPFASYEQFGFGLFLVALKDSDTPIGMCGLLKRETLPSADIGFAFLPQYWSQGFAFECADAVLKHAREAWSLSEVLAITSPDNESSMKLLGKLGFEFQGMKQLTDDQPEVRLFRLSRQ
jgi:RimJ/RimL family protein N-acetyltransferase